MAFRPILWRVINSIQQSYLIPTTLRMAMLRLAGLQLHPTARIASYVFIGGTDVHIGEDVFINIHCFLDGNARITIGEGVHVGPYTKFLTGSHSINPGVLRRKGISANINLPIKVKRGAWIGLGTIVLPGVTIEEGCVIGAGSVVNHSTEPNGLYAGSPARRIKDLPTEPV